VLRDSPLRRGPRPSRCVHSVALGSAQSCTAAHNCIASLHVGASRLAQLAAALRDLAVPLRAEPHFEPRALFSLELLGGPLDAARRRIQRTRRWSKPRIFDRTVRIAAAIGCCRPH